MVSEGGAVTEPEADTKVTVQNVNVPGRTTRLDARMHGAMWDAMLKALPDGAPGLTQEIRTAMVPHLPDELFPAGGQAGWRAKLVQLDLEAKGLLTREPSKPLGWHRTPGQ